MTTIATECNAAALAGLGALLNSGKFVLQATGPSTLATLTFANPAFGTPTNAAPSVMASNSITASPSATAGEIALFQLQTSGLAARISGSVSDTGLGGDLEFTDATIPSGTTSVEGSLTLTLAITG